MFRSVLVPLDRSTFAEHALPLAVTIARRAQARLDLVQVHELYALADPAAARVPYDRAEDTEWQQQERLYLEATARWVAAASSVEVTATLVGGLVADALLGQARVSKPDLIVMATHARGAIGQVFLGSVADEVLRRAPAPLLVLRPADGPVSLFPGPALESVLVPLDGSPLSERVLPAALGLARLLEARCTLLRVVEPGPQEDTEAQAMAYLERVAAGPRREGLQVQTRLVVGRHAAEAIVQETQAGKQDLVALATHGRGGLRRLLLGSVAAQVIRGVCVPVLVYRPPEA
jgi:nucleotide-binding universal stress UspA family protein